MALVPSERLGEAHVDGGLSLHVEVPEIEEGGVLEGLVPERHICVAFKLGLAWQFVLSIN